MFIINGKIAFRSLNASYHQSSSKFVSQGFSSKLKQYGMLLPKIRLFSREFYKTVSQLKNIAKSSYGANQIQVLEGLEAVRKRPGMYIGSTGQKGLHQLFFEILDNAIDEVQAGYANEIKVEIDIEVGRVTISDNGRGIPTEIHPKTQKSTLETVLTVLHAGGKFGGIKSGYSVSGGLHGVGISVVNALSEDFKIKVWRNGCEYTQSFSRGHPINKMEKRELDRLENNKSGTQVSFLFDCNIFAKNISFDKHVITSHLRELSFLNQNALIAYIFISTDKKLNEDKWNYFQHKGGLKAFINWLNKDKKVLHPEIYFKKYKENLDIEICLQWCSNSFSETILSFVNNTKTIDGGTHIDGLKTALTRTINNLARKYKLFKDNDPNLNGDIIREGLIAILSLKIHEPEFEGQTKSKLGNPLIRKIVDAVVSEEISLYFELHLDNLNSIINKSLIAFKATEAAKKARELIRRKSTLIKSMLPGKLADCLAHGIKDSELFIVEGDSAGGSTKQGRDRKYQAVLPLRGKIINAERYDKENLYKNTEIMSLILAMGLDEKDADLRNLRYNKIVILTDADVDGAHIRTLLLNFLFRFNRRLFDEGKIYIAVPPLYKLTTKKDQYYCYSEDELMQLKADKSYFSVQRFKGLGEMMPEQLWKTTLNPKTRHLHRLKITDVAETNNTFSILMGSKVEPRKILIEKEGIDFDVENLDI